MDRNVKNVKNSLKFKANVKQGILSVRVGVKKFAIPGQARILSNGDYIFLSFSANSELYKIQGKKLTPMDANEDATAAYAQLNPGRKARRRRAAREMSPELANALRAIPFGYKLGYDLSGSPRLVKKRLRRRPAMV